MAEPERGVVLKTTPLRESDLLVVLYTATHGRVAAVARGARKSQRRFAGALQLLADAFEFDELPVRHNEDLLNADLARRCRVPLAAGFDSPHVKAHLLL